MIYIIALLLFAVFCYVMGRREEIKLWFWSRKELKEAKKK